ncbi:efflux RND transporter permease subunit [Paraferrimonas sedimenticola]|uniref:Acriflavin resistance protein n=1 Tax=Paraferrimonas sedimenticola TaxID=375674 RepID=A0AA37RVS7_9GAMM|nr:efflux RND transporter permease subunit [Paraferrimonas sedimenticola]GLP95617.1 acriflavin resistance protein [Paraferrimonas sedimenticola]
MLALISAALSRARTMSMLLVLILVAGAVTFNSIPKEAEPDITIPIIYVSITHDGISPEDGERMLVRPMEQELRSLEGIKEMRSTASEGHASVVLEFVAGFDPKSALADVRDRVTLAKAKLPADTEEPTVNEVTLANENAVITVTLSGSVPERTLIQLARDMRDKLEGLREVLEVEIGGNREDILEIIVDPLLMESYQLDQNDIFNLISRNNRLVAAGTMDTGKGRFAVKVPSVFESLKDVLDMPIKVDGDRVITFADVATIRRAYKDANSYARLNGEMAVSLEVKKRPGENIIDTVAKVKQMMDEQKKIWPQNLRIDYSGDSSKDVKEMLTDLQNNVLSAIILVVIVVIAALGWRSASLVGIAIPGSFLTGILVLAIGGLTINMMVLFALIMAVGMLVDGAIVVTEFADRRMMEGAPRKQAYAEAAKRMAWPIIASTATTLAAFGPLLFWPDVMGEFMRYLPLTLIATLAASLMMALLFVPVLGSMFGKPRLMTEHQQKQIKLAESGDATQLSGPSGSYTRLLRKAIHNPWKILFGTIALSVGIFVAFGKSGLGVEFFPTIEPPGLNITVRSVGDLSIDEKDQIMRQIEQRIIPIEGLETLYTRVGGNDQVGRIRFNMVDWKIRPKADDVVEKIYAATSDMGGVEIEVRKDQAGPNGGKDLRLQLSSRFPALLNETAQQIKAILESDEAFVNVDDNSSKPGIEWQLNVDRQQAARFGADASLVGSTVQFVTNGLKIGEYRPDDADDELDIRVRFPEDKRNILRLDDLRVKTIHGQVPISNFVERKAEPKVDSIRRVDSQRVLTVQADMAPGQQLGVHLPRLQAMLPEMGIDPRVNITVRGENEQQNESQAFLMNAFLVALFVMAIILVTQFNSFYQAGLILTAVLFSTVGVFLALLITQSPFGVVMSGIGVIALAGIVVNNNIVLIDTYNVLRRSGMSVEDAILRTGAQRLRPVMLTTITTILGLTPMVLKMNVDLVNREVLFGAPSTQWWSQLATAVAGGLAFATLLTLILTPCLIYLRDRPKGAAKLRLASERQQDIAA